MHDSGRPPDWLDAPAAAVLRDLQGAQPIAELAVVAYRAVDLNGLHLAIAELSEPLPPLEDDLDPETPTEYGGGNWVPRTMTGPRLLVLTADILQEDLAETDAAWAQSRPPCPWHPHPARAAVRDGEAWWVCERDDVPLYRIGRGEVPTRPGPPLSWNTPRRSRRAEKRQYGRERHR
ncbi:hypothetical protein OJ997_26950 [Solirubrobacter phytolaccae]|uniref:Uncharacterized protein n=1 Tax=Solirubrobacter phytolaccae TaxID=1404360 RepID=A0A9X3NFD1_9ACTN|nr:hypothetical protein [Solirubrobacter phytolaccae]MDA0183975.1 hypothetical protein [Solirubrobacter phytolaccae]